MEEAERLRLWIGNLDEKITEYQLLKIVQKYGPIKKFDLLYNRNGPQVGKSRGYGFVTYKNLCDAEKALNELNGKFLASKHMSVKWAHAVKDEENDHSKLKPVLNLPVLTGPKEENTSHNSSSKIRAIERKLKMMEQKSDLEEFLIESFIKKPKIQQNKNNHANFFSIKET